jgi:hypothetical protein
MIRHKRFATPQTRMIKVVLVIAGLTVLICISSAIGFYIAQGLRIKGGEQSLLVLSILLSVLSCAVITGGVTILTRIFCWVITGDSELESLFQDISTMIDNTWGKVK